MGQEEEEVTSSHSYLGVVVEQKEHASGPLKSGEFSTVAPQELWKAHFLMARRRASSETDTSGSDCL